MSFDILPVRLSVLTGSCCFIADGKTENVCGLPANTKKFLETLAGLPQTPKSSSRHLRDSRKQQKVFRDTCGTPANTKKFLAALAGLPQTPKSFSRHLRESRKCLGELVGRYNMLSMTFSIRKSHSFVELTLCDTDIKPYRANPYVKRTPYRPYTPSPLVRRNTRTDLHPNKTRANPTKHLG